MTEQDIYGVNHDADSPSEEWVAGYIAATAAAEQRLRERIEALAVAPMGRPGRVTEWVRRREVLALLDTPPPASPRQGEPVDVERLARAFVRAIDRTSWIEVIYSGVVPVEVHRQHFVERLAAEYAALSEPTEAGEPG